MGDGLTDQTSLTPYGDIFDRLLPDFLAMGMEYDDYWDGEVGMKTAFRQAHDLKIKMQQRLSDQSNWYMGQYMAHVLNATPLLVAGLNVKRGTHLPSYPEKPFFEKFDEEKKIEEDRKRQEDQMKLALAMFQAGIERFNKNIQKRLEKEANDRASGQHE